MAAMRSAGFRRPLPRARARELETEYVIELDDTVIAGLASAYFALGDLGLRARVD
jgi:hypothetical protein